MSAPRIRMELPVVWEQTRALRRYAWEVDALSAEFRRLLFRLEAAWKGSSADEFFLQGLHLRRQLETLTYELDELADLLQQEAAKWTGVDRQGARRIAQLSTASSK